MLRFVLISILFLAVAMFSFHAHAQQEANFSQYTFYKTTFNPGFAGSENAICATGAYRYQWAGFNDAEGNRVAPETFFASINAPVRILRGGLSAVVMNDKLGYESTINVKVGYAYQAQIGFGKLGIGTQIGFNNRKIDFSKLKPVSGNDPIIISGEQSDMLLDFSLGLFYNVPGSYYIGISGVNLLQSQGKEITSSPPFRMRLDRTFYLTGGYEFVFPGNPAITLIPSTLIQTNASSLQIDLDAMMKYKDIFWGGLGYRLQDAVKILLGVQYKDFKIGYSYDVNVSKLKMPVGGGTHEVMLKYCFKLDIEKGRKSYRNTRFL